MPYALLSEELSNLLVGGGRGFLDVMANQKEDTPNCYMISLCTEAPLHCHSEFHSYLDCTSTFQVPNSIGCNFSSISITRNPNEALLIYVPFNFSIVQLALIKV